MKAPTDYLKTWLLLREAKAIIKYHVCKSKNYYRQTDFITDMNLKLKNDEWNEKYPKT
jgi:hypothetical protein